MLATNRASSVRLCFIVEEPPSNTTSTVQPVAAAAAAHISAKRSRISRYSASRGERTMNQADVRLGMMLAAVPPSWMIPWTRASGRSCWRHSPTELNSRIERVERVATHPRLRGGVRLAAVERDVDVLAGEQLALDAGHVRRVEEERRVEPGEQAVADHDPLARATLLGRRAEEHDLAGQLGSQRGERDRGTDPRGGHRVVAAAVAEPGQRVVLRQDADPRPLPSPAAGEDAADGGRQAADRVLDGDSRAGRSPRRPRPTPGAPRTRAQGSRGSAATGR